MVTEKIDLIISVFDKTGKKIEEITRKVQNMGGGMERTTTTTKKLNDKTNRLNLATKKVSTGMARFKMNLLSVMFFGAMLSKAFGGLFTSMFEVFGITELWNATIMMVMLPVMELLAPVLYNIMEWFMNLPEPVKLLIGIFAGLMAILGTGLMLFGAIGLGIAGLVTTFGSLTFLLVGLPLIIGAVVIIFALLSNYLEKISTSSSKAKTELVSMGVSSDSLAIIGNNITKYLGIAWDWIKSKAPIMWDALKNAIMDVVDWISTYLPNFIASAGDIIMALVKGIISNVDKIITAIIFLINKIVNFISDNLGPILEAAAKIIDALITGLFNNLDKLLDIVIKIILKILEIITNNLSIILEGALKIMLALADGLAKNIDKIINALIIILNILIRFISENLGPFIDAGLELLLALVEGITENLDVIIEALVNGLISIAESLIRWIANNPLKFIQIGLEIAFAIIKGVGKGLASLTLGGLKGLGNSIGSLLGFAGGGVVPGTPGAPVPAIVHGGETIIPAGKNAGGIAFSPTYNIYISDKREIERLIDANNKKMVEDLRRLIET